jgi:hypothetical protein
MDFYKIPPETSVLNSLWLLSDISQTLGVKNSLKTILEIVQFFGGQRTPIPY